VLLGTLADLAWLKRCERLTRKKLENIQTKSLRIIVKHAGHKVPFYRKLYESIGVDPDGITNLSDIRKLPIVTKQQLRDTPLMERTAIGTDIESCRTRVTSGATGIPVRVLVEPSAVTRRIALWLRRWTAYGIGPRDRVCVVIPGEHNKTYFWNATGLEGFIVKRRIRTLSLAEGIHENADVISKWRPTVLVGPASYHRALIGFLGEANRDLCLRVAIANGEMLNGLTRKLMAEKYHTDKVFETFSAAEVGPIAWECPAHSGYHINAESVIVEFLHNRESVSIGEPGELCVTNLHRRATPVIRYLVGDVASASDEGCACGRGLPLMRQIQGRLVDYVVTRDGTHVSPFRVMQAIEDVPGLAQYKVIQDSQGRIELDVVLNPSGARSNETLQELVQRSRQLFTDTPVSVKEVESIDAPGKGKSWLVQSYLTRPSTL
jgi:phenylacetate-CoA ligase